MHRSDAALFVLLLQRHCETRKFCDLLETEFGLELRKKSEIEKVIPRKTTRCALKDLTKFMNIRS